MPKAHLNIVHLYARVREGLMSLIRSQIAVYNGELPKVIEICAPGAQDHTAILTLDELIEEYLKKFDEEGLRYKGRIDYQLTFKALKEVVPAGTLLSDINRRNCREFRDLIASIPPNATKKFPGKTLKQIAQHARDNDIKAITPQTANSHLTRLGALFNYAVQEQYITSSPAKGLSFSGAGHTRHDRLPFDIDDLNRIFSAPLYTGCVDDGPNYKKPGKNRPTRSRYWLPLIALYQGMRLGEIAQLQVADIREDKGIPAIDVTSEGEEKRIKTDASQRMLPIHPVLLELGFMAYVESIRNTGSTRLWPEMKPDKFGKYYGSFPKWFSRFLEHCGVERAGKSFHSFRHSFKDAAMEAGLTDSQIGELGGWASGKGAQSRYGLGLKIQKRFELLSRIEFEGLDLGNLK